MKALRIGLVIALVATLALFVIPTSTPVNAQAGCTPQGSETWCIKYDYSTSAFGATVLFANGHDFGTYTGGTGFVAADDNDGGSGSTFRRVVVEAPLPTSVTVLRVKVTYNRVLGPYAACTGCAGFYIIDHSGGTYGSYVVNRSESGEDSAHGTSYSGSDTFTVSLTGLSALEYYLGVCVVTSGSCSGNGAITAIELAGTGGGIPTATPTPTMTPTPAPVGTLPAPANYDPCPLMGDQNANTTDGARWNLAGGAFGIVPPPGFDISSGYIDQLLTLSRYNKYIITLKYRQTVINSNQAILFSLGKTPAITIPLTADLNEQTYTSEAANYEPTTLGAADNFDFFIAVATLAAANHIIVTYACVSDQNAANPLGPGGAGAGALSSLCLSCTYTPGTINGLGDIINNIVKLLQWLWCGFSQIWDCSVRPFFATLLAVIGIIIAAIAFIRQWVAVILANGNDWLGAVLPILAHWVAGFIINVIQALLNAAATLARSLGLSGLFDFLVSLFQNAGNIFNLITAWVQTAIQQILNVLAAIPTIFNALISGYNHSATSTGAVAPVCTDSSNILYGPCLGMYVLDNTIFNGPTFYAIPLALGLVAFNTILWASAQIRNALTR